MNEENALDSPDDDWSEYESGPFCRHWGELGCCDICTVVCVCGHICDQHEDKNPVNYQDTETARYQAGHCNEPQCNCLQFKPKDQPNG